MIRFILFTCFIALLAFQSPTEMHQFSIQVEGIKYMEGNLGVLLFDSKKGFPEEGDKAVKSVTVKVDQETMLIELGSFPNGEYAVTLMHDINQNGMLDKNFFGIPKEPFGFTKLQSVPFGAPSFDETSIVLTKSKVVVIKMLEI